MPIKFFAVPALDPGDAEAVLNRFMRGLATKDAGLRGAAKRKGIRCSAVEPGSIRCKAGAMDGDVRRPPIAIFEG